MIAKMSGAVRIAAFLLAASAPALAEKTDVLTFINGDRITGDIKSYESGQLTMDTFQAGYVPFKWNKLLSIVSSKVFDVETTDGVHHYGTLGASDPPGKLVVLSSPEPYVCDFLDVFRIAPVLQTFWKRWQGSFDLGFNYTHSNDLFQLDVNADATYRVREFALLASLSTYFSHQHEAVATDRANFSLIYDRFLPDRWILEAGIGAARNVQLGLKLRPSVGVGGGRNLVQTNQTQLVVVAGLLGSYEYPVSGETKTNAEAFVAGRYTYFMYEFPKITASAQVAVYPSLTTGGRVRLEASGSLRRELLYNFYLTISVYDSYDSRDPSTGLGANDWGPSVAIGWRF